MPIPENADIQYLRVSHTGQTKGPIHLSDLNTEDNARDPYKVPVYVPEEGSVDIPLNDQVLLSFNQGSIRRHIDDGRIKGAVVSDDGAAEVWVSESGDDDNPGTKIAPKKTIQQACLDMVERYGPDRLKTVYLVSTDSSERFRGPIVVPGPRWRFVGVNNRLVANDTIVTVYTDPLASASFNDDPTPDAPAVVVVPWTEEAYHDFLDEGGVDYEINEDTDEYEYTGADIIRENSDLYSDGPHAFFGDDWALFNCHVRFENILFARYSTEMEKGHDFEAIAGAPPELELSRARYLYFENCRFNNYPFFKHFGDMEFDRVRNAEPSSMIFDYGSNLKFQGINQGGSNGNLWTRSIYVHQPEVGTGGLWTTSNTDYRLFGFGGIDPEAQFRRLVISGTQPFTAAGLLIFSSSFSVTDNFILAGTAQFANENVPVQRIFARDFIKRGTGPFSVKEIDTNESLQWHSDSWIRPNRIDVGTDLIVTDGELTANMAGVGGDAEISGTDTEVSLSGTIHGNLTVTDGASIDFTGVTVLGDVDLTGAGDVTWRGGSFYGALTDPDDKLGAAVAGDYLNVTP